MSRLQQLKIVDSITVPLRRKGREAKVPELSETDLRDFGRDTRNF